MTKTYIIASNLAKLGKKLSVKEIKELTQSEINEIDDAVKKVRQASIGTPKQIRFF